MQKLDALVAIAGGAILVLAIVAAAVQDASGGPAFDVTFPTHEHAKTLPAKSPIPDRDVTTFAIDEPDLAKVNVTVSFLSATAFPPTATAHVKLTSPEGASRETDVAPPGVARLDFPLAAPPNATSVRAGDASAAERAMWPSNSTLGVGNWTLEVSFSLGAPLPSPPPGLSSQVGYGWTAWTAKAALAVPASK